MNIGNFSVEEGKFTFIPDDNNFQGTLKITWLPAATNNIPVTLRYFGHLCSKAVLGPTDDFKDFVNPNSLREFKAFVQNNFLEYVKEGDTVQLERMGFFYIDEVEGGVRMHYVPEGSKKKLQVGDVIFDDE